MKLCDYFEEIGISSSIGYKILVEEGTDFWSGLRDCAHVFEEGDEVEFLFDLVLTNSDDDCWEGWSRRINRKKLSIGQLESEGALGLSVMEAGQPAFIIWSYSV